MKPPKKRTPRKPKPTPAFWLVWRDGGYDSRHDTTPRFKHGTEKAASAEAARLAEKNPNVRFYVLPATAYAVATINPVEWATDAKPAEEEVPF